MTGIYWLALGSPNIKIKNTPKKPPVTLIYSNGLNNVHKIFSTHYIFVSYSLDCDCNWGQEVRILQAQGRGGKLPCHSRAGWL